MYCLAVQPRTEMPCVPRFGADPMTHVTNVYRPNHDASSEGSAFRQHSFGCLNALVQIDLEHVDFISETCRIRRKPPILTQHFSGAAKVMISIALSLYLFIEPAEARLFQHLEDAGASLDEGVEDRTGAGSDGPLQTPLPPFSSGKPMDREQPLYVGVLTSHQGIGASLLIPAHHLSGECRRLMFEMITQCLGSKTNWNSFFDQAQTKFEVLSCTGELRIEPAHCVK